MNKLVPLNAEHPIKTATNSEKRPSNDPAPKNKPSEALDSAEHKAVRIVL